MEKSSKDMKFTVIIASFIFKFSICLYQLSIKGYELSDGMCQNPIYDVTYQDRTLPQEIYERFKSIRGLINILYQCRKHLFISTENHCLLFNPKLKYQTNINCLYENQWLKVPLISEEVELIELQTHISFNQKKHKIKKVQNPKILPYIAAVRIVTKFDQVINTGSGVIVGKTKIFTVAHNVYSRSFKIKCTIQNVKVYVQTLQGQKEVKVKSFQFPNEYETTNQREMKNYDFAYIFLQDNDVIEDFQILEKNWKKIENKTCFQVIGYSPELDSQNACYHLAGSKFIDVYERYATYDIKAANGISGGPVVVYDLEEKKWKIIGLHQGFHPITKFSVVVLLTTIGKSPFQIINQLDPRAIKSKQNQIKQKKRNRNRKKISELSQKSFSRIDQIQDIINQFRQRVSQKENLSKKKLKENKFEEALQQLESCLVILYEFPGSQSNQYKHIQKLIKQVKYQQKVYQQCQYQSAKKNLVKLSLDEDDYIEIHSSLITRNSKIEQKNNTQEQIKNQKPSQLLFQMENSQSSIVQTESTIRDIKKTAIQLYCLGYKDYLSKKYDKSLQQYQQAKKMFERGSKSCVLYYATACNNVGSLEQLKKNYEKAKIYYIQALSILQKNNLKDNYYRTIQQNLKRFNQEREANLIIDC